MEQKFDDIAEGKEKWREVIEGFYTPFHANLENGQGRGQKELMEEKTDKVCEKCGTNGYKTRTLRKVYGVFKLSGVQNNDTIEY